MTGTPYAQRAEGHCGVEKATRLSEMVRSEARRWEEPDDRNSLRAKS